MSKVATHTAQANPETLANKGQTVVTAMTGNPNFTDPRPALVDVTGLVATCRMRIMSAKTAADALALQMSLRDDAVAELRKALNDLGRYVQTVSKGEASVILSSGFDLAAGRQELEMAQVTGLRLTTNEFDETVIANFKKVKGVRIYEIQICLDDGTSPKNWVDKTTSTKTRVVLNSSLKAGQRVWVRVRAVGAKGAGPWSDPAVKTVP